MSDSENSLIESMESQLVTLYAERELLKEELGVCEATEILAMVKSLEGQLVDMYSDRENAVIIDGSRITITGPKKIFVRKTKP